MRRIAIYVEGGGDTAQQKSELRVGLDCLLNPQKQAAREKRLLWRLVPSGSRNFAFAAFINAIRTDDGQTLCVLLVDSESAVTLESKGKDDENARARRDHLSYRDSWDLTNIDPSRVHLMVQCMEAWLAADSAALARYYGKGFHARSLPQRENLEEESKLDLYLKLAKATKETSKGEYSDKKHAKIKHASKILALIEPKTLARRCPRFATLTSWLDDQIRRA